MHSPILILGAGPAGLSLAFELIRRGLQCRILEKGTQPGESFAHYPKHIWFGPWLNNTLPGSRVGWTWLLRRARQPAYTWYLGEYARRNHLPIHYQTAVTKVRRNGRGFLVETEGGSHTCDLLVNATGYFSKPYIPDVPGMDLTRIKILHSSQYREAEDARKALGRSTGRVLVVGQGLSAGETMTELNRAGFQVSLSVRGPLKIGPSVFMETLLSPLMWIREQIAVRFNIRLNSNPPMAGGETSRLIRSGWVPVYPVIDRFQGDEVVFENGEKQPFDLVVYCTGYRYAMDHLRDLLGEEDPHLIDHAEALLAPGLFFLGLDQQRSFRSRFLRGIREDARYLANVLAKRVTGLEEEPAYIENEVIIDLDRQPALV